MSSHRVGTAPLVLVSALLTGALAAQGCSGKGPGGEATSGPGGKGAQGGQGAPGQAGRRGPTSFPVELAPVESRVVEYAIQAVGSVEPFEVVQVTARVAGAVQKVRFSEGDRVQSGTPLVEIDPDRYRIAVQSAQAALDRALAAQSDAKLALERREGLDQTNPGLVRQEELQTFRTRFQTAAAEVAQARAALDLAQVNLRDAYVRAPVGGTVQTRTVQTGQYVQPGTVLATLVRKEPLLLRFEIPEQDAARLSRTSRAFFTVAGATDELAAKVVHIAEVANPTSRMVSVVAHVERSNHPALRPGAFAQVRVPVGDSREMPVVPQTAVRPSERGFLAFVVEGNVAHERVLTLGLRTADGRVEVRSGLQAGEMLVVRGAEALREGVTVKPEAAKSRPGSGGFDAGTGSEPKGTMAAPANPSGSAVGAPGAPGGRGGAAAPGAGGSGAGAPGEGPVPTTPPRAGEPGGKAVPAR